MIKKILIGLVVAIVLLGLYAMLASKKPVQIGGLSSTLGSGTMGQVQESNSLVANERILKILGSIQSIDLNDEIFINPIFRTLKDKSFTIPRPVRRGRKNPFLPIGYDRIALEQGGYQNSVQNSIVSNFINGQANGSNDFFGSTDNNTQANIVDTFRTINN